MTQSPGMWGAMTPTHSGALIKMADLLSITERLKIDEAFGDFFDTLKKTIEIHKEAKQAINDIDTSFLLGYGETSNQINYQYIAESKTFEAIVSFPPDGDQDHALAKEISAYIPKGEIRIKVKTDAKDYIKLGKVERINIGDHAYTLLGEDANINNIINGYYVFKLGEIK